MWMQALWLLSLTLASSQPLHAQSTEAPESHLAAQADAHTSTAVTAILLGEEVRSSDADEVQAAILTRLFNRYAEQQGIEVSDAEIDSYVDDMQRSLRGDGLLEDDALSPAEAAEADQIHRAMGRALIQQWKLNRALYAQYGGRIIYQQFGPEPLDAYRQFLEERQAAEDFKILDPSLAPAFWRYFTEDSIHTFYKSGSDEEAQAFATLPWER